MRRQLKVSLSQCAQRMRTHQISSGTEAVCWSVKAALYTGQWGRASWLLVLIWLMLLPSEGVCDIMNGLGRGEGGTLVSLFWQALLPPSARVV